MATKDIPDIDVCNAFAMTHISRQFPGLIEPEFPYDFLMRQTGQPFKVCYRAMERAAKRGLIEYGTSLRTGWLTEKGEALLHGLPPLR